jgi:POT family proton-dependent oligopeptide transporter
MFFGLITFISGKRFLEGKGESLVPELLAKTSFGIKNEWLIYGASALSALFFWQMVQSHEAVSWILKIAGGFSFLYIVYFAATQLSGKERDQLIALTILIVFTIVFWALFEQAYTSLNLFADRILDRNVLGFELTAGQFLSFNALFIILLAPVFAWLWVKLGKYNPNTAVKFAIALLLVGLGFGSLVMGINVSETGKVAAFWLILTYLLHTCGELSLSPVGLSAVTKLSPVKIVGFMMGVWFLATASSEFIAGVLANIASIDTSNGTAPDLNLAKQSYLKLFEYLFYTGIGFGLLLLVLSPVIKKLMHGVDKELNN